MPLAPRLIATFSATLSATVLIAACGTSSVAPVADAAPTTPIDAPVVIDAPGPFVQATHPPFPSVTYQDGTVLTAPYVVSVFFPNDPMTTDLTTFGANMTAVPWWDVVRAGYCESDGTTCVGDGTIAGTSVVLTTAPAATYSASQVASFVSGLVTAGTVPPPDANTIYNVYFPATTTISLGAGADSCTYFDAYHDQTTANNTAVYYAVVPECAPANSPAGPPLTLLQNTTLSTSHEVIETATDGSDRNTGFYLDLDDAQTWGWDDIEGGEVADLCVDPFGLGEDETLEGDFTVQRIWSIGNATAGKNPCIPIPDGEVYFNAAPVSSALAIDVGQSQTIEVDAWSDAPMAAWTVNAQDWSDSNTVYLDFKFTGPGASADGSSATVSNGGKLQLTVTLKADPGSLDTQEADGVITSFVGTENAASQAHYWPFIVVTPTEASDAGVTGFRKRTPAHDKAMAHHLHHQLPFGMHRRRAL